MQATQTFKAFYDASLLPTLEVLEGDRKKLVRTFFLYIAISILVAIPLYLVLNFLAVVPFVIAGIVYFVKYGSTIKEKKDHFKREVIGKMIGFIDTSLAYEPSRCVESGIYHKSKLFLSDINRYKGDDMVSGMIGKTAIRFCELHTELETVTVGSDGKRNKQVKTIFRGIFFTADFNKKFVGETFVLPDVAESWLGSVGTMFQKMNMSRPKLVKLEDVEFEKAFAVYGTDQVEARYILSTALMQRLLAFKNKTRKSLSISFIDSQIYIAIPMKENMFEATLFSSLVNYDRIAEYHNYMALCVGIVETLDLNTRIWLKE
jgi:hypothetical protein